MEALLSHFNLKPMTDGAINSMSPLKLAFLGDAVYGAYVRYYLIHTLSSKVNDLHKASTQFVKASSQAGAFKHVLPLLTPEELSILMRGRNQKTKTVAKNASVNDYRQATGFEALIGYLSLKGDRVRLEFILTEAIEAQIHPKTDTEAEERSHDAE